MRATKPGAKPTRLSVILSRKHDNTITKSSKSNSNQKPATKVRNFIKPTEADSQPFLETSSQADHGKLSESEEDDEEPVYDYKVIQHLDFPGEIFEIFGTLEKTRVIGIFDDLKEAEDADGNNLS